MPPLWALVPTRGHPCTGAALSPCPSLTVPSRLLPQGYSLHCSSAKPGSNPRLLDYGLPSLCRWFSKQAQEGAHHVSRLNLPNSGELTERAASGRTGSAAGDRDPTCLPTTGLCSSPSALKPRCSGLAQGAFRDWEYPAVDATARHSFQLTASQKALTVC